ncbi:hypothetical protein FBZ89_105112 [Nitrospirillum amazonense]|uniref:Uncharacterized protein n=1 Tax=Nitrospirillum amazonense TaxID=28077 RepID=A0A560FI03_9PROT|nr:hypothetical protein [Nitrospirillum amazonense]TWB21242.1 hypothetical protein FBZ89_105112 [Nitrospirillum amazonense]
MAISFSLLFGIAAGLTAAGQVASSTARRIRRMRRDTRARRRQVDELFQAVRDKAKLTLDLKREERKMTAELEELRSSVTEHDRLAEARRADEALLYVYDERRMPNDSGFTVTITHSSFQTLSRGAPEPVVSSWRMGRRYLVWASSAKLAVSKTLQRFPPERGYVVKGGDPYPSDPEEL